MAEKSKYTSKFMDTFIELIFGLILLPVAAALITQTVNNPDINGSDYADIIKIVVGIILIFVALGLVYHVIKQLF